MSVGAFITWRDEAEGQRKEGGQGQAAETLSLGLRVSGRPLRPAPPPFLRSGLRGHGPPQSACPARLRHRSGGGRPGRGAGAAASTADSSPAAVRSRGSWSRLNPFGAAAERAVRSRSAAASQREAAGPEQV